MTEVWAGPFLGEFGWEISLWSPWLRYQQSQLKTDFHVVCERGKKHLYEDFATVHEVTPYGTGVKRDCQHGIVAGSKLGSGDYANYCADVAGHGVKPITPLDMKVIWDGGTPRVRRAKFKSMGHQDKLGYGPLAVIHARDHQHEHRNWPYAKWEELVSLLKMSDHKATVICVGQHGEAMFIEGAVDNRGVTVEMTASLMRESNCVVGPSSGPMALALLCGTQVIWWSGNSKDIDRFATHWNPFSQSECKVGEGWQPSVAEVLESCLKSF